MRKASMTSSRSYLFRAIYEWISDNKLTPFVIIDANYPDVLVPEMHVEDGQIVLNIAEEAVRNLLVSHEDLVFDTRFSGILHSIYAPMGAIVAIYASENGRGMVFEEDPVTVAELEKSQALLPAAKTEKKSISKKGKPTLTIVK